MTERDQTPPHGSTAVGAQSAQGSGQTPHGVSSGAHGPVGAGGNYYTAPQYTTTPIALRRPDAFAALMLVLAGVLSGIGLEIFQVGWDVSVQSNVSEDKLSRVYAYDWFGSLLFIPVGQILAGPLAAGVGVDTTIVGCGVVVLLATVAALLVPAVRNLRGSEEPAERAQLVGAD